MADEQKPKGRKTLTEPEAQGSISAAAEGSTGAKAGKKAPKPEVAVPAPPPSRAKSQKPAKLQKKNKSRLPRRQKKALQKASRTKTGA